MVEKKVKRPYIDSIRGEKKLRSFSESTDDRDLVWHRDSKDRNITVIKSNGWQLQTDGALPVDLIENLSYFVERDEWHRLLKGRGELVIKIEEF